VASTRRPCVMTLRIAQPGELCAMKQSRSMKIRESMLWNTKEQSGRGFNLAATSALGHVTAALAFAAPELDSTLINKLTDDKRSVVFDGAVRSVPFHVYKYYVHCTWKNSSISFSLSLFCRGTDISWLFSPLKAFWLVWCCLLMNCSGVHSHCVDWEVIVLIKVELTPLCVTCAVIYLSNNNLINVYDYLIQFSSPYASQHYNSASMLHWIIAWG